MFGMELHCCGGVVNNYSLFSQAALIFISIVFSSVFCAGCFYCYIKDSHKLLSWLSTVERRD